MNQLPFPQERKPRKSLKFVPLPRGKMLVNTHSWQVAWKATCKPGPVPMAVVKTHARRGDERLAASIALSQQACWCLVSAISSQRVACWTPFCFLLDGSEYLRKIDSSPHIQAGPLTVNIINHLIRVRNICNSLCDFFVRSSPDALFIFQSTGSNGISFLTLALIPPIQNGSCCFWFLSVPVFYFILLFLSFSTCTIFISVPALFPLLKSWTCIC